MTRNRSDRPSVNTLTCQTGYTNQPPTIVHALSVSADAHDIAVTIVERVTGHRDIVTRAALQQTRGRREPDVRCDVKPQQGPNTRFHDTSMNRDTPAANPIVKQLD